METKFRRPVLLALATGLFSSCLVLYSSYSSDESLAYRAFDYMFPADQNPDIQKDLEALVVSKGFKFSRHEIVTSGGYIIELHRINHRHSSAASRTLLPVVIGMHLCGSSASYVMDSNGLAFSYADAGFDVWIVNGRGSRFGRKHVALDRDAQYVEFYNFTLIDLGAVDLAEQLDYIVHTTGHRKVNYVGVSQGAASYFAMLSKKPSYNALIAKAVSFGGFRSVCLTKEPLVSLALKPLQIFGSLILDILPVGLVGDLDVSGCSRFPKICELIYVNFVGFKSNHYLNKSRLGVYGKHFPAGTSLKNILWYAQSLQNNCDGRMNEFDYDFGIVTRLLIRFGLRSSKNLLVYGSVEPPSLNLKNIKAPLKIYYSDGDDIIPTEESLKLQNDLNVASKNMHRIPDWRFNHFNFVIQTGSNAVVQHSIDFFYDIDSAWKPFGISQNQG